MLSELNQKTTDMEMLQKDLNNQRNEVEE